MSVEREALHIKQTLYRIALVFALSISVLITWMALVVVFSRDYGPAALVVAALLYPSYRGALRVAESLKEGVEDHEHD